jgi:thiol-disulfide isomerase/thioredoxin
MRRFICRCVVASLVATAFAASHARVALGQVAASSPSALELFKAVDAYPQQRREKLRAEGKHIDRETGEKIAKEQKELAARNAATLAARPNPSADDLYYLGLIYNYAERRDDALDALRRFLSAKDAPHTGAGAQLARSFVAIYAAQTKQFDEAERVRADFLANDPKTPYKIYQIEFDLGAAYAKAKQYDRAVERLSEAFKLARELKPQDVPSGAHRETLVFNAGDALAGAYTGAKRQEDALKTVVELHRMALELPSANLYDLLRHNYADRQGEVERALATRGREETAPTPPELNVAEWIGETQPLKLSELRGRVVLLDFWYEWCAPCRASFPTLVSWQKKYKEKGLVVIGLTDLQRTLAAETDKSREDKLAYLRKFARDEKMSYAVGVAERGDNLASYGVNIYPTSILIDRRGTVRLISIGASPRETERLGDMIDKLTKEPAP